MQYNTISLTTIGSTAMNIVVIGHVDSMEQNKQWWFHVN